MYEKIEFLLPIRILKKLRENKEFCEDILPRMVISEVDADVDGRADVCFDREDFIKFLKDYNYIFTKKKSFPHKMLCSLFSQIVSQCDYKIYKLASKALKISDQDYGNNMLYIALNTNDHDIHIHTIEVLLRNDYFLNRMNLKYFISDIISYFKDDKFFDLLVSTWSHFEGMKLKDQFNYLINERYYIDWLESAIRNNNFKIMKLILQKITEMFPRKPLVLEYCILEALIENKSEYIDELLKYYFMPPKIDKYTVSSIKSCLSHPYCENLMNIDSLQFYHKLVAEDRVKFPSCTTRYLIYNASFNKNPVIFTYLINAFPLDAIKAYNKGLVKGDKYQKQILDLYEEYM